MGEESRKSKGSASLDGTEPAGMKIAAAVFMATVIGVPGRYATKQSIRFFQRMLVTTMLFIAVVGIFEGIILGSLLGNVHLNFTLVVSSQLAGALAVVWLCKSQSRRIDFYERKRLAWRSGAEGEGVVAAVLDQLPQDFVVFHDFNTVRGNFDHFVIGPTGVFAIETKNWRGTIGADGQGELTQDRTPSSQPYVRQLTCRIMQVREQVIALAGKEVFIQGVIVFPKAKVNARFGETQSVRCVRDVCLRTYIEDKKYRKKLTTQQIDLFTRAFRGIAGMDASFQSVAYSSQRKDNETAPSH